MHWKLRFLLLFVPGMLCGLLTGCQLNTLRATSLPSELSAPQVANPQQLDLTRFARSRRGRDLIQPGDLIRVSIMTGVREVDQNSDWTLRVAENGTVDVPLVGPVYVAEADLPAASAEIRQIAVRRGIFNNPRVTVRMEERRMHAVTVSGAVEKPGVYELPAADSDLVAALVAAGGLKEDADTVVEIRHPVRNLPNVSGAGTGVTVSHEAEEPNPQDGTERIDLLQAAAAQSGGVPLEDGSVVLVRKKPQRVIYVMGLVKKPDRYEMPADGDLRLLESLAMAGGRTVQIADKVSVVRQNPNGGAPIVIRTSIREAQQDGTANLRLAPSDVVKVEETPSTFVVGTLEKFMRFGFSATVPGI